MYTYSGHYRTLVDMLAALGEALGQFKQIPIEHYKHSMDEVWIPNVNANRDYL
ncbi:MAG TPA: hypothetical protein VIZ65_13630 [Cellvibrionaceae bacterium]